LQFYLNDKKLVLKRIGLISDTHGYLDDRIIEYLQACDEIWHAGDIGTLGLLGKLEEIKPVKAVFGNIDDQKLRTVLPEIQRFFCEETDILIKHIGGYTNQPSGIIYLRSFSYSESNL
jgi:predicted phosphodiesterase